MFVIAGVSGHVGGAAARALLADNKPVKVIVRDAVKGREWSERGAEIAVGDLDDPKFVAKALTGATGFFTLVPPNYSATDFYAAQRRTADSIAAAVKTSGVPHVVMLSSTGADLADGTGPIKGLHYLENALRATGTKLSAIRAGSFQENIANSVGAAKASGVFPNFMPSQDHAVPMIATKDIGNLVARTLASPPARTEVIDLHGPAYSIKQQADMLGAALGKPLSIVDIPPEGHVAAMTQAGMTPHVAEVFAEMYAGFASGKIVPKGDRMEQGSTKLDEVIRTLV